MSKGFWRGFFTMWRDEDPMKMGYRRSELQPYPLGDDVMEGTMMVNVYLGLEDIPLAGESAPAGPEGYHLASHVSWNCTREQLISLVQDLPENGVYRCAIATVPDELRPYEEAVR